MCNTLHDTVTIDSIFTLLVAHKITLCQLTIHDVFNWMKISVMASSLSSFKPLFETGLQFVCTHEYVHRLSLLARSQGRIFSYIVNSVYIYIYI